MYLHGDIPICFGTPAQSVNVVSVDYRYLPPKLVSYHGNIP